ncbi:preprotein translocase subunit SecE [Pseudonocardia sp. CA-107938]|uniref:preprotein translocase subunit SecE n=1 Tax=Pseudonocardia sp. CA-107938 TaxID=3240021 RepID=UPI003D95056F
MAEEHESDGTERERPRSAADRRGRRSESAPEGAKGRATAVRDTRPAKGSPFARITRFLREVVAELRKVFWPSRPQLVTYTIVVLVFVSFMVALVAGLDFLFGLGIDAVFGTS